MNISKLKSSKDRLEGAIAHGKLAMEEKFGGYEAVEIENGDYDSFIEEKKALANGIENELQKVNRFYHYYTFYPTHFSYLLRKNEKR